MEEEKEVGLTTTNVQDRLFMGEVNMEARNRDDDQDCKDYSHFIVYFLQYFVPEISFG